MAIFGPSHLEKRIWKKALGYSGILLLFIIGLFSIFFGMYFQSASFSLPLYVIDFDGQLVGQEFMNFIQRAMSSAGPDWIIYSPINYNQNPDNVVKAISQGKAWGAIMTMPRASSPLVEAVNTGKVSNYTPSKMFSLIYDSGRHPSVIQNVLIPMRNVMNDFRNDFASQWIGNVSRSANASQLMSSLASNTPQIMTQVVGWSEEDISSGIVPLVEPLLTMGMMILFLFEMGVVQLVFRIGADSDEFFSKVSRFSLKLRLLIFLTALLTLMFSILVVSFKVPFNFARWMSFWCLYFVSCMIFGIFIVLVISVISEGILSAVLLTFLVLNVTVASGNMDLASPFYRWGMALPMTHTVSASRTLIYGSHDTISLNVGILFLWLGVLSTLWGLLEIKFQKSLDCEPKGTPTSANLASQAIYRENNPSQLMIRRVSFQDLIREYAEETVEPAGQVIRPNSWSPFGRRSMDVHPKADQTSNPLSVPTLVNRQGSDDSNEYLAYDLRRASLNSDRSDNYPFPQTYRSASMDQVEMKLKYGKVPLFPIPEESLGRAFGRPLSAILPTQKSKPKRSTAMSHFL